MKESREMKERGRERKRERGRGEGGSLDEKERELGAHVHLKNRHLHQFSISESAVGHLSGHPRPPGPLCLRMGSSPAAQETGQWEDEG